MRLGSIVIDSNIADELADFYAKLLGWKIDGGVVDGEKWLIVKSETGEGTPLVFQTVEDYVKPQWPWADGVQQQMLHLDFYVSAADYDKEVAHAIACGAQVAETPFNDNWKVMLDPAGHPFCIIPLPTK